MTSYTFPSIAPTTQDNSIVFNSKVFVSPLTGAVQTAVRGGHKWMFRHLFSRRDGDERQILQAYLILMGDQLHRAIIYDHSYHAARGALGGTPVIDGADQTGNTINIRNMGLGTTDAWKAGDQLSFLNSNGDSELKMVLLDADTDGAGDCNLTIRPGIHHSPADGAAIVTTQPTGTFMMLKPKVNWSNKPDGNAAGLRNPNQSTFSPDWVEDIV